MGAKCSQIAAKDLAVFPYAVYLQQNGTNRYTWNNECDPELLVSVYVGDYSTLCTAEGSIIQVGSTDRRERLKGKGREVGRGVWWIVVVLALAD